MTIRSKFLLHWTGNDIEGKPADEKPQLYLDRLKECYGIGLYTKRITEPAIRGIKVEQLIRLCFTEIKLSDAREHSKRYGYLGIGFTREFIRDKGGRSVIYIPFKAKAGSHLLEESIRSVCKYSDKKAYKNIANLEPEIINSFKEIQRASKYINAYIKRMSNHGDESAESYEDYYEELEWRIVHDERNNKPFVRAIGDPRGIHRLEFDPHDVQILIFADSEIRQKVLADADMKKHFSKHMPILVTIGECLHF